MTPSLSLSQFISPLLLAVVGTLSMNAMAADQPVLADRHAKAGVPCAACHGPDPKNLEEPSIEQCQMCHNTKALVEKTAHVKPRNPHTSPHYKDQLDCVNCHSGHDEPQNFCAQCHSYDFKVK